MLRLTNHDDTREVDRSYPKCSRPLFPLRRGVCVHGIFVYGTLTVEGDGDAEVVRVTITAARVDRGELSVDEGVLADARRELLKAA